MQLCVTHQLMKLSNANVCGASGGAVLPELGQGDGESTPRKVSRRKKDFDAGMEGRRVRMPTAPSRTCMVL
jgi:hypothetical protein